MFDAKKLLDQFLGAQVPGTTGSVRDKAGDAAKLAKDNPLATGAIVAVLLGTKTGRELTGGALKLGGLAAIAGLGYQAYKNYQAGKAPDTSASAEPTLLPPPADSPFSPQAAASSNDFALALVRAMIAAAKSDGHVDEKERSRIMDKIHMSGLGAEAEAFIELELANPTDVGALVAAANRKNRKWSSIPPRGLPSILTAGRSAAIWTCSPDASVLLTHWSTTSRRRYRLRPPDPEACASRRPVAFAGRLA